MDDLISRQTAIEALAKVARDKFNLSDEFNHYLAGLVDGERAIRDLPSAQPEIMHCRDCKYWREGRTYSYCQILLNYCVLEVYDYMRGEDDFCSMAEKREE